MRHFTTAEAGLANDGNDPGDDPNTGDVTFLYNRLGQTTQTVTACNATSRRPGIRVATDFDPNSFSATRDIIQIDPDLVSTTSDGDSDPTLQRVLHRAYESAGAGRPLGYSLRHTTAANSTVDATTTYGYSTTGRLETVSSNPLGGTTTTSGFAYGYLSNSNLIETVRSYLSGTTGTPIHSVTNTYESARDVLDKKTNTNGFTNVEISATEYTVNNLGQRDGVTRTGAGTAAPASANASYAYNSRGELVEDNEASAVADRAYQYNDIGNREKAITGVFSDLATASANYASNPLNQYTRANNVTLPAGSYDLDGNLLSGPVGASPSNSATLVWDGENRLITATVGSTTVSYIYDGLSRRVARTVGTARTFYIYDGCNCVAEYGGSVPTSGAPTANAYPGFVHTWGIDISGTMQGAGGVGGLLASTKLTAANAGTTYYPLFDGNGNITSYIDSSRNVQAYFNYDPFGNQIDNSYSNPIGLSYAFSTKAFDTDTGLYYYGYRWYDPLTGRWPSRDPIGENGGVNLYGFVKNRGIDHFDRLGLSSDLKCRIKIFVGHNVDIINAVQALPREKVMRKGEDFFRIEKGGDCGYVAGIGCTDDRTNGDINDSIPKDISRATEDDILPHMPTLPYVFRPLGNGQGRDDMVAPDWVNGNDWDSSDAYKRQKLILEAVVKSAREGAVKICDKTTTCCCPSVAIELVFLNGSPIQGKHFKKAMEDRNGDWVNPKFKYEGNNLVWHFSCN